MFSKTYTYPLLKPIAEVKPLLAQVAAGHKTVLGAPNLLVGALDETGLIAVLKDRDSKCPLKVYTALLSQEDGMPLLRVKVDSSVWAVLIELVLIALAVAIVFGAYIPVLGRYAVVLPFIALYFHLIGFSGDAWGIGALLDPEYFNSPEGLSKMGSGMMNIFSWFNNIYFIGVALFFVAFIGYMLYGVFFK